MNIIMTMPKIVYFSSVTENTRIFLEQLPFQLERIPIYKHEPELVITRPYILALPTYGGGWSKVLVPPQVKRFLNVLEHRKLCVGIIGSGNMNFGETYAAAADLVGRKLGVPVLARFELRGTGADKIHIQTGVENSWKELVKSRGLLENRID